MEIQELIDRAEVVRTEQSKNANTAERVGSLLRDIALGLQGTTALSNTAYVNQDLSENDEAKRIFNTYEVAVAWIIENGSPSVSCQWQIMLPGGFVPVVTVYEYIKPCGCNGTVIGEYRSAVPIPENPLAAIATAYGSNMLINLLNIGNGRIGVLVNCLVLSVKDSACAVISEGTSYFSGFLAMTSFISASYGQLHFTGQLRIVEARKMSLIGDNVNLGGSASFCLIDADILVGKRAYALHSILAGAVNVAGGGVLETFNCSGNFVVTGDGDWINKGSALDARGFGGCLDSATTDTQRLAEKVDSLSSGMVLRSPGGIPFLMKVNDLGEIETAPL